MWKYSDDPTDDASQQKRPPYQPQKAQSGNLCSMLGMALGTLRQGLGVHRGVALRLVPPGALAVQVSAQFGGFNGFHGII